LGLDIVQTYKFKNFSKKPTQYQVKIEKLGQPKAPANVKETKAPPNEFTVDTPTINAIGTELKEGVDVSVNIKFEPSSMNEAKSLMTITSVDGGTYQCYLIGQSSNPQPKGPIKVSPRDDPRSAARAATWSSRTPSSKPASSPSASTTPASPPPSRARSNSRYPPLHPGKETARYSHRLQGRR
jgi:hypothetical protein